MFRSILTVFLFAAVPLRAEVPRVVTDFAPVHSLVSMVMDGVGSSDVLLRPGASPHSYAMRPSDASALENADLVVWIGRGLTPWLEGPIEQLAGDARILGLLEIAPVQRANEVADDHGEHDDHKDHDDHDDHDEHAGHDDHGDTDPHAWLDPVNAVHWVFEIAEALAALDESNADAYRENAQTAAAKISALQSETAAAFAAAGEKRFAVHHDSYGYFEDRFGLDHAFAITNSHSVTPGAARIAELRESVRQTALNCVLTDGIESRGLLDTVVEGHQTRILVADPTGGDSALGPLLYMDIARNLADALSDC